MRSSIAPLLPQVPLPPPSPEREKLEADLAGKINELRRNLGEGTSEKPVTDSMIVFAADASKQTTPPPPPKFASPTDLQKSAYAIAYACQKSVKTVWNVGIWQGLWELLPFKEAFSRVFQRTAVQ